MAKNAPKTTANTENNVYNQHKTTTCRITDEDEKNENTEPEKLLYVQQAQEFYHEPIENENSVFPSECLPVPIMLYQFAQKLNERTCFLLHIIARLVQI